MAYFKWHDAILKLAAAFGLTPDELSDELVSESLNSVSSPSTPGYSPFRDVVALRSADGTLRRLTTEELDHWKSVNTALYWRILPSLNLDSAQLLSDMRKVNSFYSGRLADGCGKERGGDSSARLSPKQNWSPGAMTREARRCPTSRASPDRWNP